ncbi:ATP-binding protein [Pseudomonas syringae pv. actinidifoliorum]|nr:ATP-binding protein [Pseudomonas syringae pv. actinidifoliorum]MDU8520748.1 ATP-binding protein [Pseudomonas syringae pv. actinidifoliorum]MDU8528242.1 ATP-binding protein [Pseudomonas syringae pv. actinidifoliorum]
MLPLNESAILGPWNEQYSRGLIENLPVGVYVCNQDAIVVAYNTKAAEIWGETPQCGDPEVRFCGAHKLFSADGSFVPHDQSPMVEVLATGKPMLNVNIIIERRDGSRVNVIASITPLFDAAGQQIGYTNCVEDVTRQMQQEADRLRMMNEQFQSQKMQTVGQLTMGIAHDFNNVLTAVTGSISLTEHYLRNEKIDLATKHASNALHGAQNATSMVSRLMTFSRRSELKAEQVDLNQLITSLAGMSRGSLGSSIQVRTQLAEDLHFAYVDPHQLENTLLNLLINAKDAMPTGGMIQIITENKIVEAAVAEKSVGLAAGEECVCIHVADTGTGMPADLISQIFEPFFTTKAEGKGTGLGLSMVYGYILQTGGCLTVDSEEGKGSCFSIHIPRGTLEEHQI